MFKKKISILCSDSYHFIILLSHVWRRVGGDVWRRMGTELENANEHFRCATLTQKESKLKVTFRTVWFWIYKMFPPISSTHFSITTSTHTHHRTSYETMSATKRHRTFAALHAYVHCTLYILCGMPWLMSPWHMTSGVRQGVRRRERESLLWHREAAKNKSVEKLIVIF